MLLEQMSSLGSTLIFQVELQLPLCKTGHTFDSPFPHPSSCSGTPSLISAPSLLPVAPPATWPSEPLKVATLLAHRPPCWPLPARVPHCTDILTLTIELSLNSQTSHGKYIPFSERNHLPSSCYLTEQAQLMSSEATVPSYYPVF